MAKRGFFLISFFTCCAIFTACAVQESKSEVPIPENKVPTATLIKVETSPTPQPADKVLTHKPELSVTLSQAIQVFEPISPLEGILPEELKQIVSNPFLMPTEGQDDGHHGTDFSFYSFGKFSSIDNLGVVSIFPGKVSAVISDRPPYGNAVIIETNLKNLSDDYLSLLDSLDLDETIRHKSNLNCPDYSQEILEFSKTEESLYVLYAHLKNEPQLELSAQVDQGQVIGNVGNTGMSGNSHLHLEMRIGPTNATFPQMAHYDNSVTTLEMANYCLWRVSNYFKLFDPMRFFDISQTKP
jgi:murein DD-endopeptidase MepM/ murein hydrolase activator NlpD